MNARSKHMIRAARRRRAVLAFSLVEVLLAIVILSLGLLGLGAVIPVVIRQQRIANETTLGVNAANNAIATLRGRTDLRTPQRNTGPAGDISPWRAWRDSTQTGAQTGLFAPNRQGHWVVPQYDQSTGELRLPTGTGVNFQNTDRFAIPVSQRLTPSPTPGGPPPRFVWDFVARRVMPSDLNPVPTDPTDPRVRRDAVQVAVFVRRIDPSIRLPGGVTLARSFVDPTLPADARRVPVAVGTDGRPTLNGLIGGGNAGYARPMVLQPGSLVYDDFTSTATNPRSRLRLSTSTGSAQLHGTDPQTAIALASQINQLLVDGFGNIYRVIGRDGEDLIIDPPVPAWVRNASDLRSIAFVPQVAAEAKVFTITLN